MSTGWDAPFTSSCLVSAPYAGSEWESRQEKMLAHALVAPTPIRELRPEVPAALAAVLERMLAKLRRDRYATTADVARALEPFTAGHNLASFLPPNRFVPAVAGFAEPSVTDRTAQGETAPTHITPSRWRPRWNWSHPPRFSKPFAIPAVLSFMTVLLLAHSIRNCVQRLDPDPAPNQGNVQEITERYTRPRFARATWSPRL